jgi:hypothetical protein
MDISLGPNVEGLPIYNYLRLDVYNAAFLAAVGTTLRDSLPLNDQANIAVVGGLRKVGGRLGTRIKVNVAVNNPPRNITLGITYRDGAFTSGAVDSIT